MRNVLLIVLGACSLAAADAPYAGKWKMNAAKSDFGQMTITYEQMPGGEIKATADGQAYTFKLDGKDAMTPWGITLAWKEAGPRIWDLTEKVNGKVTATSSVKLSADGAVMTMATKRVKSEGGTSDDLVTFQRVSGGKDLAGKWKTKNLTSSSPELL